MIDTQQVGTRAGTREWMGLAVLALPTLLLSLDLSVLYLALPQLSADLGASGTQLLWITDSYGFLVAGFLITMGTLGDRIGHRRLLLIGATAFGAASLLAAYSTSAEMLIGARALLGIAGATQMPATLALIRHMFHDPRQRGVAIAVWVSYWTAGTAIGPMVGGVLLEWFWWGSVFLLAVPVMVILLAVGPALLPESRDPNAGRLDPTSVALSLTAILSTIYGLKELAEGGLAAVPLLAIVLGVVTGVVFVLRQRKLTSPLLDLKLFKHRGFAAALVIMVVGVASVSGSYLFIAQYLQMVEGLSPLWAAVWLVPAAISDVAAAMGAPTLARRMRPGYVVGLGLAIAAVGYVVLVGTGPDTGLAFPVIGLVLVSAGLGPMITLGTDLIVGAAPPESAGAASSISETSTELGAALGIALLGTLGTAVYRNQIDDEIPAGIPAETAHAARESIAGAGEATGPLASELFDAASDAFTAGLNTVALVGAVLATILAVAAAITLKGGTQPEPGGDTPDEGTPELVVGGVVEGPP